MDMHSRIVPKGKTLPKGTVIPAGSLIGNERVASAISLFQEMVLHEELILPVGFSLRTVLPAESPSSGGGVVDCAAGNASCPGAAALAVDEYDPERKRGYFPHLPAVNHLQQLAKIMRVNPMVLVDALEAAKQEWILSTEEIGGTLGVYDMETRQPVHRVYLGERRVFLPHEIAISKDGKRAYITPFGNFDYAAAPGAGSGYVVVVVNLEYMAVERYLYLYKEGSTKCQRAPHGIKVSPDGKSLWVNCEYTNVESGSQPCLVKFDLTNGEQFPQDQNIFPLPQTLNLTHNIMFTEDGRYLFLQASTQGMGLFDTITKAFETVFTPAVGNRIHGLNPAGKNKILVSGLQYAWVLDVTDPHQPCIDHQYGPFGNGQIIYSSATKDNKYVLLPAPYSQQVFIVDRESRKLVKKFVADCNPTTVTLSDDGKHAYVSPGNGTNILDVDMTKKDFPQKAIFTQYDAATNRIALVPKFKVKKPEELKIAVILSLTDDIASGKTFRPIGTVMRNTWTYGQELKNMQGGVINEKDKCAYTINFVFADDESSASLRSQLVAKALNDHNCDFVIACHPDTEPLTGITNGSPRLISYAYSASGAITAYTNNLSYNDWQAANKVNDGLFNRFNVPVTNEQYTTLGVFTLLSNIIKKYSMKQTGNLDLHNEKLYYFGMIFGLDQNHEVTVTSA